MVEIYHCHSPAEVEVVVREVLEPAGIEAAVHQRENLAFPAPATQMGAYFVAVDEGRAAEAREAIAEARQAGLLSAEDGGFVE